MPIEAGAHTRTAAVVELHPARELPLVALQSVSKSYGKGVSQVHALREVDLRLQRGELLAICGPSGSGKSTLLNVMGGVDQPDSGSVQFMGQQVNDLSDRKLAKLRADHIGFVFQFFNLLPALSVSDNVKYALMLNGHAPRRAAAAVDEVLDAVGIAHCADRSPLQLSGGQQQRVAIARALVKKPALIIADEPTGNLDSATGQAVLDLMRKINRDYGTAFAICTHSDIVRDACDRVIHIVDGRIQP